MPVHVEADLVQHPPVDPRFLLALDLLHVRLDKPFLVLSQRVRLIDRLALHHLLDQAGRLHEERPVVGLLVSYPLILGHFRRQRDIPAHVRHPVALHRRVHVHPAAVPGGPGAVLHRRIAPAPRQKLVNHLFLGKLPLVLEETRDLVGRTDLLGHVRIRDRKEDHLAINLRPITRRMIALQMVEHRLRTDEWPPDILREPHKPRFHGRFTKLFVRLAADDPPRPPNPVIVRLLLTGHRPDLVTGCRRRAGSNRPLDAAETASVPEKIRQNRPIGLVEEITPLGYSQHSSLLWSGRKIRQQTPRTYAPGPARNRPGELISGNRQHQAQNATRCRRCRSSNGTITGRPGSAR